MHQFRSGREVKDYYTAALEGGDYYTAEEQKGRWCGELAKRLGMNAGVTRESFARLADNQHPVTGEKLTPRTNDDRTVGYDINFHVPKGVSLLHVVSGDDRILDAIRESAHETMRELEKASRTRVRTDGKQEERATGELVWGEFLHTTTRPEKGSPDPHLHVHCFAFNATFDHVEDRIKATHFRDIKRDMPYYEAAFYSRLAWRLEHLGYGIERSGKSWDVAGIPQSVKRTFSRRTTAIEELAKKLGITEAGRKAALGARSRSRKQGRATPEELRSEWLGRMSEAERAAIEQVARGKSRGQDGDELASARHGLDAAISHRFERESVVAEPRLLESALRFGLGQFRPESLRHAATEHPDLLRRREASETQVTIRQVVAEEHAVLRIAREGRGAVKPLEGDQRWEQGYANLNKQQARAIEHLLRSNDRIKLVRGGAGTGKTSLLREAAKAITARGHPLAVIAPTADASRGVLRDAGFRSADTIAKFLSDPEQRRAVRKGVIWVDEAGLIGVPTMKKLFEAAVELDAQIVLCGDSRQHAPIERGDALRLIETRLDLKAAEVTEVLRQQGTYKQAVQHLAKGRFDRGIEMLDQLGAIREMDGKDWVPLVEDYMDTVRRGRTAMVIAPTHAEGAEITSLVRAAMRSDGRLGQDDRLLPQLKDLGWTEAERQDASRYEAGQVVQFHRASGKRAQSFKPGDRLQVVGRDAKGNVRVAGRDGIERTLPVQHAASFTVSEESMMRIAVGETLRASGGGRTMDGRHRLNTGAVYRVQGFTPEGNVRLDNGWIVARDFARWQYGYVSTSHSSQGRTVDWVYIAQGTRSLPASSAEQVYVSVSRGRQGVRLYTDDRRTLIEAVSRLSERRSASDLISAMKPVERTREHAATLTRLRWYEQRNEQDRVNRNRMQERAYVRTR